MNGDHDIQNIYTQNGTYSESSLQKIMDTIDSDMIKILDESKTNSKSRDLAIKSYTKLFNSIENDKGKK